MFKLLITIYRANPYRPHCNAAAGRHVWLCRRLSLPQAELCPNTHPGEMMCGDSTRPPMPRTTSPGWLITTSALDRIALSRYPATNSHARDIGIRYPRTCVPQYGQPGAMAAAQAR